MRTGTCRPKFSHLSTRLLPILLGVLAVGGLLLVSQPASAQTCIQDVWKAHGNNQNLQCTANDVTLSRALNIDVLNGGLCQIENGVRVCRCFDGLPVTFTADFEMDLTADTRYDIGFYIATDNDPNNDGALTGACIATGATAANTTRFLQLDPAPDVCGDISGPFLSDFNPQFVKATIGPVTCTAGPSGKLELDFCTTWRQPGSNETCLGTGNGTTTNDVFPGSPSKCNCGTALVDIIPSPVNPTVTKTALTTSVLETGGSASYSVTVKNNNQVPVTLTSLTDNQYGDITTVHDAVTATTCVPDGNTATCEVGVGGTIAAGATCECMFTATVPPGDFPGSFTDVVTGCVDLFGQEKCDDDDAVVPYADQPQPPSLTKTATAAACQTDVTYAVVVTNGSAQDTLTLKTLNDDVYGDITTVHDNVISTTCGQSPGPGTLPAVIAVSGNYACSFVGRITGCNTTLKDTVTGTATDDDGRNYDPTTDPPFPGDDATVIVPPVGGLPLP
jgi:hypothetical protein